MGQESLNTTRESHFSKNDIPWTSNLSPTIWHLILRGRLISSVLSCNFLPICRGTREGIPLVSHLALSFTDLIRTRHAQEVGRQGPTDKPVSSILRPRQISIVENGTDPRGCYCCYRPMVISSTGKQEPTRTNTWPTKLLDWWPEWMSILMAIRLRSGLFFVIHQPHSQAHTRSGWREWSSSLYFAVCQAEVFCCKWFLFCHKWCSVCGGCPSIKDVWQKINHNVVSARLQIDITYPLDCATRRIQLTEQKVSPRNLWIGVSW